MTCEDCENYKPKKKEFSRTLIAIKTRIQTYCQSTHCEDCVLGEDDPNNYNTCLVWRSQRIIVQAMENSK